MKVTSVFSLVASGNPTGTFIFVGKGRRLKRELEQITLSLRSLVAFNLCWLLNHLCLAGVIMESGDPFIQLTLRRSSFSPTP